MKQKPKRKRPRGVGGRASSSRETVGASPGPGASEDGAWSASPAVATPAASRDLERIEGEIGAVLSAISRRAAAAGGFPEMTEGEERAAQFLLDVYGMERKEAASRVSKRQRAQDLERAEELLDEATRARDYIDRKLCGGPWRSDPEWKSLATRARDRCSELVTAWEMAVDRLKHPPRPGPDPGWETLVIQIRTFAISAGAAVGDLLRLEDRMPASTSTEAKEGSEGPPVSYVTLEQMAAICSRAKRTLEKRRKRPANPLPDPDVRGGGGKPSEWVWTKIRPWLVEEFNRPLPEVFPTSRFRDATVEQS